MPARTPATDASTGEGDGTAGGSTRLPAFALRHGGGTPGTHARPPRLGWAPLSRHREAMKGRAAAFGLLCGPPRRGAEPGGAPQPPQLTQAGGFSPAPHTPPPPAVEQDGRQHPGPPAPALPAAGIEPVGRRLAAPAAPGRERRGRCSTALRAAPGAACGLTPTLKDTQARPFLLFLPFSPPSFFSFLPSLPPPPPSAPCRTAGATSNARASAANTAPGSAGPSPSPAGGCGEERQGPPPGAEPPSPAGGDGSRCRSLTPRPRRFARTGRGGETRVAGARRL